METGSWISKTTTFMAVARFFCHGDGVGGGGGADTLSRVPKAASPVGGSGVSSPRKVLNLEDPKLYFQHLS